MSDELTQADKDYLESIKDVTDALLPFEEARKLAKGCPDPEFYADEPSWDEGGVFAPPSEVVELNLTEIPTALPYLNTDEAELPVADFIEPTEYTWTEEQFIAEKAIEE